jgi:hypothetical protein
MRCRFIIYLGKYYVGIVKWGRLYPGDVNNLCATPVELSIKYWINVGGNKRGKWHRWNCRGTRCGAERWIRCFYVGIVKLRLDINQAWVNIFVAQNAILWTSYQNEMIWIIWSNFLMLLLQCLWRILWRFI